MQRIGQRERVGSHHRAVHDRQTRETKAGDHDHSHQRTGATSSPVTPHPDAHHHKSEHEGSKQQHGAHPRHQRGHDHRQRQKAIENGAASAHGKEGEHRQGDHADKHQILAAGQPQGARVGVLHMPGADELHQGDRHLQHRDRQREQQGASQHQRRQAEHRRQKQERQNVVPRAHKQPHGTHPVHYPRGHTYERQHAAGHEGRHRHGHRPTAVCIGEHAGDERHHDQVTEPASLVGNVAQLPQPVHGEDPDQKQQDTELRLGRGGDEEQRRDEGLGQRHVPSAYLPADERRPERCDGRQAGSCAPVG